MKKIIQQDLKYLLATLEFGEGENFNFLDLCFEGESVSMDAEEWQMLKDFVDEHWKPRIVISQEYEIAKRKGEE